MRLIEKWSRSALVLTSLPFTALRTAPLTHTTPPLLITKWGDILFILTLTKGIPSSSNVRHSYIRGGGEIYKRRQPLPPPSLRPVSVRIYVHAHAHARSSSSMISSCAPRARDGKKTPSTNQLTLAMLSVPGCVDGRPSCNDLKDKKKCWQTRDRQSRDPLAAAFGS